MASLWSTRVEALLGTALREFGEPFVLARAVGGTGTYNGIFQNASDVVTPEGQYQIVSLGPALGVRLSDFGGTLPKRGDTCTLRGTSYKIEYVRNDGEGGALLHLIKP